MSSYLLKGLIKEEFGPEDFLKSKESEGFDDRDEVVEPRRV